MTLPTPNQIAAEADNYYVSYNTTDHGVYGGDTTALVWGQMQGFYILMGDHRLAYRDLITQGWAACYAYYLSHPDLQHKHSDKTFPPPTVAELTARTEIK